MFTEGRCGELGVCTFERSVEIEESVDVRAMQTMIDPGLTVRGCTSAQRVDVCNQTDRDPQRVEPPSFAKNDVCNGRVRGVRVDQKG